MEDIETDRSSLVPVSESSPEQSYDLERDLSTILSAETRTGANMPPKIPQISTDGNEFPANFPRISVSSPLYPAKAPRRRTRSVVTRDECRAHPSSRHTHKRCFASRMRRIALKWRSIRHCDWGIAHRYFLSFFLHMRGGNYGSGHSASTSSCKMERSREHPGRGRKHTNRRISGWHR